MNSKIALVFVFFFIATVSHTERILVDIDGVIADFTKQALEKYKRAYPNEPSFPVENRSEIDIAKTFKNISTQHEKYMNKVLAEPEFCLSLPLIDGAKDALNEMIEKGHSVFLVPSPMLNNPTCAQERYTWVEENLGEEWVSRLVITDDKTIIKADILIDDETTIEGDEETPSWTHVLFHQSYNADDDKPRLKEWDEWETILKKIPSTKQEKSR